MNQTSLLHARVLTILTIAAAILAALATMDLKGIVDVIPGDQPGLVAIISAGIAALLSCVRSLGDFLDDGKNNNSFK